MLWFPWSQRLVLVLLSPPDNADFSFFFKYYLLFRSKLKLHGSCAWKVAHFGFSRTVQGSWHVWMKLVMASRVEIMLRLLRFRVWLSSMVASRSKLKFLVRTHFFFFLSHNWIHFGHCYEFTSSCNVLYFTRSIHLQHLWHKWLHRLHKRRNSFPG